MCLLCGQSAVKSIEVSRIRPWFLSRIEATVQLMFSGEGDCAARINTTRLTTAKKKPSDVL